MSLGLIRELKLLDATCIVVGTVIGTGIFLKAGPMAFILGHGFYVLLAWLVAGLLSFAGALCYAELGPLFPEAGGEFIYLEKAQGPLVAFLYGWSRFFIGSPASIAAYSVGICTFAKVLVPSLSPVTADILAVSLIIVISLLNCMEVKKVGHLQTLLTGIKILAIASLAFGLLFYPVDNAFNSLSIPLPALKNPAQSFSLALIAALWAFDGWNNLSMVAGEIMHPKKNIPLSFMLGLGIVLLLYLGLNLAYFRVLPFNDILQSYSSYSPGGLPVATNAAKVLLPANATTCLAFVFILSSLGAMNGSVLTGARVPYAMAHEHLFFNVFKRLRKKAAIPYVAVLIQGMIASLLALSGTFDQLTNYVVFSAWIFYALCGYAVIIFRRKYPIQTHPRSYQVWGHPFVPLIFVALAFTLLINTLLAEPKDSLVGLLLILSGVPVYYFVFKKRDLKAKIVEEHVQ